MCRAPRSKFVTTIDDHWGRKYGSCASLKTQSRLRKQFYALFDVINAQDVSSLLDRVCLLIQHDTLPLSFLILFVHRFRSYLRKMRHYSRCLSDA